MAFTHSLLQPIIDHHSVRMVRESLENGSGHTSFSGLTRSGKAIVIAALAHELRRPLVVLSADNESAECLRDASATFLAWLEGSATQNSVSVLPALDCTPYESRSPHAEILERRAEALWNLASG